MIECTVDTHVLAEILMQYSTSKPNLTLERTDILTEKILKIVNTCIESNGFSGVVVASTFAFIEIVNKFKAVSKGKFNLSILIAVLNQPPDWFVIEPYSSDTVKKLIKVPKYNLSQESVEMADAIHVATAMQRGPNTYLATHDGVLANLNYKNLELNHLL